MKINNSPPCKTCPDSGCGRHSRCEKYLAWYAEYQGKKETINGRQKRERMLNEFYADGCIKQIRRSGGKV